MSRWYRRAPFSADHSHEWQEHWEFRQAPGSVREFDVRVRAGKALDVLALKGIDLSEVIEYSRFLRETAERMYGADSIVEPLPSCPMCSASLELSPVALSVFGVDYVRCRECGHVLVRERPALQVFDSVFAESEQHSSTYVDTTALETRMTQIVGPKLDWCHEQFRRRNGDLPARVLDVGAGGGHFLAGAARRGAAVEGFEKSKTSCSFAREAFGLTLRQDDFLTAVCGPTDLVTFWGVLEYVENPRRFLAAARRALAPGGLLVVEVPRVDALGTAVQAMEGAVVARHMDPTTHVNGFTDESLCTALVEEGFAPVAAWYFGMDAYETCVQIALRSGNPGLLSELAPFIPALQQAVDRGRQCDDVIIAAVAFGE